MGCMGIHCNAHNLKSCNRHQTKCPTNAPIQDFYPPEPEPTNLPPGTSQVVAEWHHDTLSKALKNQRDRVNTWLSANGGTSLTIDGGAQEITTRPLNIGRTRFNDLSNSMRRIGNVKYTGNLAGDAASPYNAFELLNVNALSEVTWAGQWSTLVTRYEVMRQDCICNSDCGINFSCACHNDCGCNYGASTTYLDGYWYTNPDLLFTIPGRVESNLIDCKNAETYTIVSWRYVDGGGTQRDSGSGAPLGMNISARYPYNGYYRANVQYLPSATVLTGYGVDNMTVYFTVEAANLAKWIPTGIKSYREFYITVFQTSPYDWSSTSGY